MKKGNDNLQLLAEACKEDLWLFCKTVASDRYFGDLHRHIAEFLQHSPKKKRLLLVPRDHQKSIMVGLLCAWWIIRDPSVTIAYVTATQPLAKKQVRFIQKVLESDTVRHLWPELFPWYYDQDLGRWTWSKRDIVYTSEEFEVGHPIRFEKKVPELTVTSASVGINKTGFHFQKLVFDDVVIMENYRTEDGRAKVRETVAMWSSIATTGCETVMVGTRYGPLDTYQDMIEEEVEVFDEEGNFLTTEPTFEVFQREVEDKGDGTGNFIWPRMETPHGSFGFDIAELAAKRASYRFNMVQYYCQYYNDPNRTLEDGRDRSLFQYMNPSYLKQNNYGGSWHYNGKYLKLYAGMDCAWTEGKKSDYSAIVVVGVDEDNFKYVLEIERFKTDGKIDDYLDKACSLYEKWFFRRMKIETNAAGKLIMQSLKDRFRDRGISCSLEGEHKNKREASKKERLEGFVLPMYDNQEVFHFPCGLINQLEDELILTRPPHDDMSDALGCALSIAKKPVADMSSFTKKKKVVYHPRFGGIRR